MSGATDTGLGAGQGISSLVGNLATDLQDLVRGEIRLAKAELDRNISQVVTGAASLVGGAVLALAGLEVLLQGGAVYLIKFMPAWAAFAAIGGGALIIGAIIAWSGSSALSLKTLAPNRSSASLRKDIGVIKENS